MELDRSLMLRDEGQSAYHGDHVTKGAFGGFLREVEAGHVPPGSVLIAESMDRMSRATVIDALMQLLAIISRGITVVTMADKREYSQDGINKNPFDLMFSIMLMAQARTEIDNRATRIRAAARARATNWVKLDERKRLSAEPVRRRQCMTGWLTCSVLRRSRLSRSKSDNAPSSKLCGWTAEARSAWR